MTITLTRGQLLDSPKPEAPATDEVVTNILCQRYAVDASMPQIIFERDTIRIHIAVSENDQMNTGFQRLVRLAESQKYVEATKLIGGVIGKRMAHPISTGSSVSISLTVKVYMNNSIQRIASASGGMRTEDQWLRLIRSCQAVIVLH